MLTHLIISIAIIYFKNAAGSLLHNDSFNISGIIANNAGRFQKGLNQITSNRATNVQHSLNSLRSANSNQKSQQAIHSPASGFGSQSLSPHSNFVPSWNGNHAKASSFNGNQQSKMQQFANRHNANHQQFNGNNFEPHNPILNQQMFQQAPGLSHHSPLISQTIHGAMSDPMLSHGMTQEIPSFLQSNNMHTLSDAHTQNLLYQNQPPMSGVPSYVLDRLQSNNFMQTPQSSQQYDRSPFNPIAPQRNQLSMDFIQTEMPTTVMNYGQPSIFSNPSVGFSNYASPSPSAVSQPSVPSPYSTLPSISSMISGPYMQDTSSSNLQALLPLILNLIQDSNSCDCCQRCGYSNAKNNQQGQQSTNALRSNHKDGRCGCKHEVALGNKIFSGDTEHNIKTTGSRTSGRRQTKTKNVKFDDSYEDYDDENDIGEVDYD